MNSFDLALELDMSFRDTLVSSLVPRYGLSEELIQTVLRRASPAVVAALVAASLSSHGLSVLWYTLGQQVDNVRLVEDLSLICQTTMGLKDVEMAGHDLLRNGTGFDVGVVSDVIALEMGLPAQPVSSLVAIVCAVMFSLLRRHLLVENATAQDLPRFLETQCHISLVRVPDSVAIALKMESVEYFQRVALLRLRALALAEYVESPVHSNAAPPQEAQPATRVRRRLSVRGVVWAGCVAAAFLMLGLLVMTPVRERIAMLASSAPPVAHGVAASSGARK